MGKLLDITKKIQLKKKLNNEDSLLPKLTIDEIESDEFDAEHTRLAAHCLTMVLQDDDEIFILWDLLQTCISVADADTLRVMHIWLQNAQSPFSKRQNAVGEYLVKRNLRRRNQT